MTASMGLANHVVHVCVCVLSILWQPPSLEPWMSRIFIEACCDSHFGLQLPPRRPCLLHSLLTWQVADRIWVPSSRHTRRVTTLRMALQSIANLWFDRDRYIASCYPGARPAKLQSFRAQSGKGDTCSSWLPPLPGNPRRQPCAILDSQAIRIESMAGRLGSIVSRLRRMWCQAFRSRRKI